MDGVNHYFSTLCNSYYSSFFTHRRKNHDTVAGLLSLLEEPAKGGEDAPLAVLSEDGQLSHCLSGVIAYATTTCRDVNSGVC